jgi:acetyl-CoA C-acetyltransferase
MADAAHDPIVIVGTARTAIGGFQGAFAPLTAPQLGSVAIKAAVERAGLEAGDVSEVLMGCVLPCTTVNKMCGSGMKTVMMAYEALHARPKDILVAGGMESMTNAPYLLPKMRSGARLGHAEVKDHMFLDGLEDAYDKGRLMGTYAEDTAQHYQLTREAQDAFAIESLRRARGRPRSPRMSNPTRPMRARYPSSSPLSAREGRSRRPTRARSRTARRRWC